MMTLESFGREGDLMTVQGALIGSWSAKMVLNPEEVPHMVRSAIELVCFRLFIFTSFYSDQTEKNKIFHPYIINRICASLKKHLYCYV
jgi:hypothetical protein